MRLRNSFAAVLLALPLTLACGSDCYDLCDEAYDEGCSNFDHGECVHLCVDQEDFSETSEDCDEEFEKLIDCISDQDSVCDAVPDPEELGEEKCNDERGEYTECLVEYCADHSAKDWCKVTP